jgi:hypothetical protein
MLPLVLLVFASDYIVDRDPQLAVKTALLFAFFLLLWKMAARKGYMESYNGCISDCFGLGYNECQMLCEEGGGTPQQKWDCVERCGKQSACNPCQGPRPK